MFVGYRMEVSSTMITTILTFSAFLAVFASQVSASSIEDGVRVRGGGTYGRVEVHSLGMWLSVCHDNWTILDATVVCRQLDLGIFGLPIMVTDENDYEEKDPIRLAKTCAGYEERIQNCKAENSRSDCEDSPIVAVLCDPTMRLVGPSYNDIHQGYLKLWQPYEKVWVTVDHSSLLNKKIATKVCLELGLGFTGSISSDDDLIVSSGDDDGNDFIPDFTIYPEISCRGDKPETSTAQDDQKINPHNPVVTFLLIIIIICIIIIATGVIFLFCKVYKVFLFRGSEEEQSSMKWPRAGPALAQPPIPLRPVPEEARYDGDPTSKAANQTKGVEEKGQHASDSVYECPKSNELNDGGIYEDPSESQTANQNAKSNKSYQNCKIGPMS